MGLECTVYGYGWRSGSVYDYNFWVCANGLVTDNANNSRGNVYDVQGPGADCKMRHGLLVTLFWCLCIVQIRFWVVINILAGVYFVENIFSKYMLV